MASIVISLPADLDATQIVNGLSTAAGWRVADAYSTKFAKLYERLSIFPESGFRRPKLGPRVRIGIVSPYIVIYEYVTADDVCIILRLIHGRRRLSRWLLQERSRKPRNATPVPPNDV